MSVEMLPPTVGKTFWKWDTVGQEISGIVADLVFDAPTPFGKNESYVVLDPGDGNLVQVPLLTHAVGRIKKAAHRIGIGTTVLTFRYSGQLPPKQKGRAPMKTFDVSAENLRPDVAPVAAAKVELPDSAEPAGGGDASFDPKALK